MNFKKGTLEELESKGSVISSKHALVGFDGFVDKNLLNSTVHQKLRSP